MSEETKRTVLAGFLIASLTLMIPFYLQLIGLNDEFQNNEINKSENSAQKVIFENDANSKNETSNPNIKKTKETDFVNIKKEDLSVFIPNSKINIKSEKYLLSFSSFAGGSIDSFSLLNNGDRGYQYLGGYSPSNENGEYEYSSNDPVSLFNNLQIESCTPCLISRPKFGEDVVNNQNYSIEKILSYNNGYETSLPNSSKQIEITGDSLVVLMKVGRVGSPGVFDMKYTTFYRDRFLIKHDYLISGDDRGYSVLWDGGIMPTEKNITEEMTFSQGFIAQNKDIETVSFTPKDINSKAEKVSKSGKTDWVGIRNKYFINTFISQNSSGGKIDAETKTINSEQGVLFPSFEMALDFPSSDIISVNQFFGPLDIDIIKESNTYLDRVMNFGWLPIQPFSRSVLWILKSLHFSGLNYGIILILFAFLIRIVTGPLTKKSFQSTQKMQTIQPKMKKLQEKFKNDSQRLNQEMVKLYKTEGVNPMGGCLPMLIQMPLLFSLFIVFRSTIEFRGAPFFGWIQDLSQPDVLFNLPFHIPIYGSHVGLLPIVLGVSMFLSQRLSMATMDKTQKPLMYIMTAFFFLLFNQFPAGLNLYYTVYNVLNYFQQKQLKKA